MSATYEPIATQTLGSSASSVTFSSISQTYTDLVLIMNFASGINDNDVYARINGDTTSSYSHTSLRGNGSAASSGIGSNLTYLRVGNMSGSNVGQNNIIINFLNYSNTTTFKAVLNRGNNPLLLIEAYVNLWRSTSAINSITVLTQTGSFSTGSTFTLYGIKAAV